MRLFGAFSRSCGAEQGRASCVTVKGFYVHLAQEPANPKVRAWNVSELKIDPIRRHVAKSTSAELWRQLDLWILQRKPHLLK